MKRLIQFFLCLMVMVTPLLFSGCGDTASALKEEFKDNGNQEPYSQNVPLSEMDFSGYREKAFTNVSTLTDPGYTLTCTLPCDVEYYTSKTDKTPAVTLEKGTQIYVLPSDQKNFPTFGYGLQCWPDYEAGWRYGQPFSQKEFTRELLSDTNSPCYYVKTEQLDAVAEAFCKENEKAFASFKEYEPSRVLIEAIDRELYTYGAFCSPELGWLPDSAK